jgi:hypothetical protein
MLLGAGLRPRLRTGTTFADIPSMTRRSRRLGNRPAKLAGVTLSCLLGLVACGPSVDATSSPARACVPTGGASGSPSSIADALALANALFTVRSEEVSLRCFVESLDRPLGILATNSLFSAQPSVGVRSPRLFFFTGNLVMSVGVAGVGSSLLELAEYSTPTRSIKAEIEFPVTAPLELTAPYDRVLYDKGTSCGFCHRAEVPASSVTSAHAFESDVLRPRPQEEVSLTFLESETLACDREKEPKRCDILSAVFGHGELYTRRFAPTARTIYDP